MYHVPTCFSGCLTPEFSCRLHQSTGAFAWLPQPCAHLPCLQWANLCEAPAGRRKTRLGRRVVQSLTYPLETPYSHIQESYILPVTFNVICANRYFFFFFKKSLFILPVTSMFLWATIATVDLLSILHLMIYLLPQFFRAPKKLCDECRWPWMLAGPLEMQPVPASKILHSQTHV